MSTPARNPSRRFTQPWVLAAVVIATAFLVETGIMLLAVLRDSFTGSTLLLALLDATVLSVALVPVLWLLLVKPVRRLADERGDLLDQLIKSQDRERARLASEIHDQVGQELTAVLLGLRSIRESQSLAQTHALAEETHGVASQCMATVRQVSRRLMPPTLADFGLASAIDQLIAGLPTQGGLQIVHSLDMDLPRLSMQTETAAFRIVQESVTNVLRHAEATEATVRLAIQGDYLRLTVEDNGIGPGSVRAGLVGTSTMGVRGMLQRAEALGGTFDLRPGVNGGTVVQAELPRTEPDEQV